MERIEQIELYIEGGMDATARQAFEAEMAQDAALKAEVETYSDLIKGIRLSGQNEFMHLIHKWEKELSAQEVLAGKMEAAPQAETPLIPLQTQKKTGASWWKIAVAACVVLVLGVVFWQFNVPDSNTQDIYNEAFSPLSSKMYIERTNSDNFTKALDLYDKKAYTKAKPLFDEVLSGNPDSVIVNLYSGINNLTLGNLPEAEKQLDIVVQSKNPNFLQAAEWYLALLALRANDKDTALQRLEAIRNSPKHDYREQAKAVLKDLK